MRHITSVPKRIAPVPWGMKGVRGPEKMMEAMAASETSMITATTSPVESAAGSLAETASARSSATSARITNAAPAPAG